MNTSKDPIDVAPAAAEATVAPAAAETTEAAPSSGLDFSKLRLGQNFQATSGVRKLITTVPVRKPGRQDFVRTHPDPTYQLKTCILELKEDREHYLVDSSLWEELAHELSPRVLFISMTRQGTLFVWPVRLPGPDGRHDEWSASALRAAGLANLRWVRLASNMSLGAYETFEGSAEVPEPEWPDLTLEQILHIAFRDRYIKDLDHPVLRALRGAP